MFIALTRPRQVVQFYYYFIITGQTLQPDNYSELLAPSTKSSPQPQECSLIFSRNENIFHFGSCRYYHGVRKDKITRYNQFLMTWYDLIYILSWKEMTIANKMVQGNGIRKIDCQLSFPLCRFLRVKEMLVMICWALLWFIFVVATNYIWFMFPNFWLLLLPSKH